MGQKKIKSRTTIRSVEQSYNDPWTVLPCPTWRWTVTFHYTCKRAKVAVCRVVFIFEDAEDVLKVTHKSNKDCRKLVYLSIARERNLLHLPDDLARRLLVVWEDGSGCSIVPETSLLATQTSLLAEGSKCRLRRGILLTRGKYWQLVRPWWGCNMLHPVLFTIIIMIVLFFLNIILCVCESRN